MKTVTQVRCSTCGMVFSEAAFPAHQPDGGGCVPAASCGLAPAPGHVWVLPSEIVAKVSCPRCGVTFSQAAHDAHRPDDTFACTPPDRMGLIHDSAAGMWHYPHE